VRGFLEESAQVRIEQSESPDSRPDINGANERYELSRAAETSVMQEVNAVTTLSLSMKDEISARGIPEAKIHVMPNAVPAEWLDIKTDHESVRSSLGLAPDEFLVGLFTTFSAHEGVPTLLDAIVNLKNLKVRVKCLLIGDGPTLESAKSLTEKYGLSNDVIFLGRLPQLELPRYYQALDLFVLPRVNARVTQLVTPLKPLEAMALGTPVVGSSVGGIKEIVEHAVTGELFKPEDAVDCAEVIQSLLYDSARRERLAEAAREWVAANRTWTGIAKRYVKLYQELGAI
ncbi:MAG: glycosyltransferase, partial [Actinobacteria bacterium]|nr:glycosyltransferase [Actinomycetota bacterium]